MAIRIKARQNESASQMLRRFKKLCEKEDLIKDKSFDMSEEFLEKQFGKGFKMSDDFKRQMGNDNIFD